VRHLSLNLPADAPLIFLDTIPNGIGRPGLALSPDGEWVGFFADNELKKVGLSGSLPVVLGAARAVYGASWSSSGEILSSVRDGGAVVRTPALGGTPESVQFSDEIVPRWPWVLPGGRAFLASYNSEKIVAVSLDTGDFAVLLEGGDDPRYLPTGHSVFQRQGQLFAVPFDPDGIRIEEFGGAQYTFSDDGTLVYAPGRAVGEGTLVWVDRQGNEEALPFPSDVFAAFRLSPQSDRLAIGVLNTTWDLSVYDLNRGTRSRLARNGRSLAWSPAETPRPLFEGRDCLSLRGPSFDIARDGRFLMIKSGDAAASTTELRVVLNWFDEVERAVAAGNPEP